MNEPRRVPGRYVVYVVIVFAILCAALATWGITAMRKLPQPPKPKNPGPFGYYYRLERLPESMTSPVREIA